MSDSQLRTIPKRWLVRRLTPGQPEHEWATTRFGSLLRDGDEIWSYDEPAPPGVLAGELGVALVRSGEPIHALMTGVH